MAEAKDIGRLKHDFLRRKVIALRALCEFLRDTPGTKYRVVRGSVNWGTWDWNDWPIGVSVSVDESTCFSSKMNRMTVSVEMCGRVPVQDGSDEKTVDDAFHATLVDDAVTAFEKLQEARDERDSSMPLIARVVRDDQRAAVTELTTALTDVQGVTVTLDVEF